MVYLQGFRHKCMKLVNHIPYGGSGNYTNRIKTQSETIRIAVPIAVQAVLSSAHDGGVFTIVDYGCADGGTSMSLRNAIVKALREKHGDSLPIHVIYEDQPVNDFKGLFLRLQELKKPFDDPDGAARKAGLNLISIETGQVRCAFQQKWMREKGDPTEYARRFVSSIRVVCDTTYMSETLNLEMLLERRYKEKCVNGSGSPYRLFHGKLNANMIRIPSSSHYPIKNGNRMG
ncbi:predicted protein [Nematostella vectensis]|uniref:Uncharacterized protein n=1 Tax=Nematostella vectensis TaxID=45351 RepID=A7S6Y8_NEMVE|nr:predicted protein [Nematostella vectensis]|eukprot:XP_001632605.1 predicted protein [Nematostella vectensis]